MSNRDWQSRLLPFTTSVISLLFIVFFLLFVFETCNVQKSLVTTPNLKEFQADSVAGNASTIKHLYSLEKYALENRYYHARLIIRTRILLISFSYLIGATICFLGVLFVLGKFSEKATEIVTEGELKVRLLSSSPGIILAAFGTTIIAFAIFSKTDLSVFDKPLYFSNRMNTLNDTLTVDRSSMNQMYNVDSLKKSILDSLMKTMDE